MGQDDEVGRADVGGEHRLLDQLVRLGARARNDLLDPAVVVADDLGLGGLEVDRTAARPLLQERAVDLVQVQQVGHQVQTALRLRAARVGKDRRHLGVGEARMRADHRRIELVRVDLAGGGDQHVGDHRQAFDVRVQRAQPVGELLRQHRDHAARKVDRGRALVGVGVERLAGLDVVADVGDRDDQAPAVVRLDAADLRRLAVDGVVEVARVLAVDRHQCHVGQVDAVLAVGRPDPLRQRGGLRQRLGGEQVRHLVLAHRDLDLHAGIVDLAEHLGDAADRLRVHRRRLGQFDRDHLAGGGVGDRVLRNEDVLAVALVFGRHQPDAALVQQPADDRRALALQDLEHAPFGAALAVVADDARLDPVAMQDRAHFLRRQIEVRAAVGADDEAVAVAMALHDAFDFAHEFGAGGRRIVVCDCFDDKVQDFLKCPGGGIGRRTSFRY